MPAPAPAAHSGAPAVFLGALASEVNEPDVLAAPFVTVADLTERVVAAVRGGRLPEAEGAALLAHLRLRDDNGALWCVGATSLRWYRRSPGRTWMLAAPLTSTSPALEDSLRDMLAGVGDAVYALSGPVLPAAVFAGAGSPAPAWEFEVGGEQRARFEAPADPPTEFDDPLERGDYRY